MGGMSWTGDIATLLGQVLRRACRHFFQPLRAILWSCSRSVNAPAYQWHSAMKCRPEDWLMGHLVLPGFSTAVQYIRT